MEVSFADLQVGDVVTRRFWIQHLPPGGTESKGMRLRVTAVTDTMIYCGPWKFDRTYGIEIDEDLGWGLETGITGSRLVKAERIEAPDMSGGKEGNANVR